MLISARMQFQFVSIIPVSRRALRPTQPPIQWVLGSLLAGLKRPGCEADHSPPSSGEVKNGGAIPPLSIGLHGVMLN
jgi:hypothetical protein